MSLTSAQKQYFDELSRCQQHVIGQAEALENFSKRVFESLKKGQVLHVFGSGHSHSLGEELFHRAGGLVPVNAILEDYLMPHKGPTRVGPLERLTGIAAIIFKAHKWEKGEVLLLASNSGINAVTVELAQIARENGIFTVGFTSLTHSKATESRVGAGKKLYEVVDLVIDTGTPHGDACVSLPGLDVKVCPLSTSICVFASQLMVARVCELYTLSGLVPPVYQSANTKGGEERNKALENQYRPRIQHLI